MPSAVKYVADVSPVVEVSLIGMADLKFWQAQIGEQGISPVNWDGKARLVMSATSARFRGIRFREWTCGLFVDNPTPEQQSEAIYLIHAFNSLRSFAWIERTLFSTPYFHGQISVTAALPAAIGLSVAGREMFTAAMAASSAGRKPSRDQIECWSGPIYLPRRGLTAPRKYFVAILEGQTQTYPFLGEETFAIDPTATEPVFGWLRESGFSPQEWSIRRTARHAKSKTYRQAVAP